MPVPPEHTNQPRIGILIVAYDAAQTIVSVLQRIPPDVWQTVTEVAVFDDASRDDTADCARSFQHDKLTVHCSAVNLGYGGNQRHGYRYFIDRGFDAVVMLHGDGQYAPELLADLYAPLVRGEVDAVFGTRFNRVYGGPRKGGMPLYKVVGNRLLTMLSNTALGLRLSEFHSGYRAYSLDALRRIDMTHMTPDFHFDTEIIVKLQHQGFRIIEVPIPTFYGDEISHVNSIRYGLNIIRALWRYRQTVRGAARHPEFAEYFPD